MQQRSESIITMTSKSVNRSRRPRAYEPNRIILWTTGIPDKVARMISRSPAKVSEWDCLASVSSSTAIFRQCNIFLEHLSRIGISQIHSASADCCIFADTSPQYFNGLHNSNVLHVVVMFKSKTTAGRENKLNKTAPKIDDVRRFWNDNPLFVGEGKNEPGTREWFLEFEKAVSNILVGEPGPILTRGLLPSSRILDVGCGPGFWVRYFLRSGFSHVSACDLTPNAVELTGSRWTCFRFQRISIFE
jgi:hypothetical protein